MMHEPLMAMMLLGSITFRVPQQTPEVAKCMHRFIVMGWQHNRTYTTFYHFPPHSEGYFELGVHKEQCR